MSVAAMARFFTVKSGRFAAIGCVISFPFRSVLAGQVPLACRARGAAVSHLADRAAVALLMSWSGRTGNPGVPSGGSGGGAANDTCRAWYVSPWRPASWRRRRGVVLDERLAYTAPSRTRLYDRSVAGLIGSYHGKSRRPAT